MLEHVLHAKKARTDLAADSGDEDSDTANTDDWDLVDFRREDSRVRNRRAVEIGSRQSARGRARQAWRSTSRAAWAGWLCILMGIWVSGFGCDHAHQLEQGARCLWRGEVQEGHAASAQSQRHRPHARRGRSRAAAGRI